jgi:hypothetical protein
MAEFVDQDRDGVDIMPLPGRCRLVRRTTFDGHIRFHLVRPMHSSTPPIAVTEHDTILHGYFHTTWARHPPAVSLYRALRHFAPIAELGDFAARIGVTDEDVAWHRKRRTGLGTPHRMTVEGMLDAIGTLTRELSEREKGKKPRPYDIRINGVSVYDLEPDQLADLSIAVDWHLGAPGRHEALAEVMESAMERLGQLALPLGKKR